AGWEPPIATLLTPHSVTRTPCGRPGSCPRARVRGNRFGRDRTGAGTRATGRSDRSDCAAAPRTSASACSSRSWLYGPLQYSLVKDLELGGGLAAALLLVRPERHAQLLEEREGLIV